MSTALLRRFQQLVRLSSEEERALAELTMQTVEVRRRYDILSLDQRPDFVFAIQSGWAARYSLRGDGTRRITGFMIAGDFCGIHATTSAAFDHAIYAVTDCVIAKIDRDHVRRLVDIHPNLGLALWRAKLVDEAILRKWLLNSADAGQATAHLLCELEFRSRSAGLLHQGSYQLPLTQEEIGDALGMTSVHTNRLLQRLRAQALIHFAHRWVVIPDLPALRRVANFDESYLHPWTNPTQSPPEIKACEGPPAGNPLSLSPESV